MINGHFYIFQDLICGGDLFSYLTSGLVLSLIPETETIIITFQLLKALDYLHNQLRVVHRDLKLENVLLTSPTPASKIVLCDFGIAKSLATNNRTHTIVGTVEYAAPEIFHNHTTTQASRKGYDFKCDSWSLGVMIHIMLSGISPFYANDDRTIVQTASKGILNLNSNQWSRVGNLSKHFVKSLITPNVQTRLSTDQCFHHPWIATNLQQLNLIYQKLIAH